MLPTQKKQIVDILIAAAQSFLPSDFTFPPLYLERPHLSEHGDAACAAPLQLAKILKVAPLPLAQQWAATLQKHPKYSDLFERIEVAPPGFINFYFSKALRQSVLYQILDQKNAFGQQNNNKNQKVILEFVSANPTGPLHVGHGRQAVLGDILANLLSSQGWSVSREFYYNDAGVQIQHLAHSVQARARGLTPEDPAWLEQAYRGEYIAEIAEDYLAKHLGTNTEGAIDDLEALEKFSVAYLRRAQDSDLRKIGVQFDHYFLESSLYTDGLVEQAIHALNVSGKTYEKEGALWLKTTEAGDDKDRVMRKSDGTYTYFVPDVAYHLTKWQRDFHKAINIQGADHHGIIKRLRFALQHLGANIPQNYPDFILHKMVTVLKSGQEVKISKRAGGYITLRELIEWSGGEAEGDDSTCQRDKRGRDAVRFFLASRKADTEFVFDIDLALKQSDDNPVYYVQYAYARICSVLTQAQIQQENLAQLTPAGTLFLETPEEIHLLQKLSDYPELLVKAAADLAPHLVTFYLRELASCFHSFYAAQRILTDDSSLKQARLLLIAATRQVLKNGLDILGVSAPEKM